MLEWVREDVSSIEVLLRVLEEFLVEFEYFSKYWFYLEI